MRGADVAIRLVRDPARLCGFLRPFFTEEIEKWAGGLGEAESSETERVTSSCGAGIIVGAPGSGGTKSVRSAAAAMMMLSMLAVGSNWLSLPCLTSVITSSGRGMTI